MLVLLKKKKILFEIGTEEQNGLLENLENYEYVVSRLNKFFSANQIPNQYFCCSIWYKSYGGQKYW